MLVRRSQFNSIFSCWISFFLSYSRFYGKRLFFLVSVDFFLFVPCSMLILLSLFYTLCKQSFFFLFLNVFSIGRRFFFLFFRSLWLWNCGNPTNALVHDREQRHRLVVMWCDASSTQHPNSLNSLFDWIFLYIFLPLKTHDTFFSNLY